MSELTEDPAIYYRQIERLSLSKKPLREFWYIGACYEPRCTFFPPAPEF